MKPELIPIYSAVISAAVAVLVSWLSSRRTVRLELDRLRLATQQLAFAKLLDVRIREYPALYAMLSDLPKAFKGDTAAGRLELALRSDIGIHGIALTDSDLSPRSRDRY